MSLLKENKWEQISLDKPFSVFVVDDDPSEIDLISFMLSQNGFEVTTASSGKEYLEKIKKETPDIIILDVMMPEISGLELLRQIRQDPKTMAIPILLVSALSDTEDIVKGLQEGANDYITKPFNIPVLLARVKTHLKIGTLVKQLATQTEILSKMAALDELTGIYNRRTMFDLLTSELERSKRYQRFLSILMMDIDHFKNVNDQFGHSFGDHVLREFVKRVDQTLRSNDTLCRYGGEEFCAILPETNAENAMKVGERVRLSIDQIPFSIKKEEISITLSIGVTTLIPLSHISASQLLEFSDKALYQAKEKGRNQVVFMNPETR
jgi:diguanylate cyclase (GGDEF)-like protein